MNRSPSADREMLLVVHAPTGRDGRILADLFSRVKLPCSVCLTVQDLCREIECGAGAAMIAEEALDRSHVDALVQVLKKQETWSDLPLLILTTGGEPNEATRARLTTFEPLADVTLLERPLRAQILVSAARAALRARAKQLQVRDRERELRAAQIRLKAVMEQMPSGLFIVEAPSGRIVAHNPEAERILGHPAIPSQSYGGYGDYGGIHPDGTRYRAEEYPIARALLEGEVIRQQRMLYRRGDGELAYLSVSAAPVRDGDRIVAAVTTFTDITEQERAREALSASAARQAFLLTLSDAIRPLYDPEAVKAAACRVLGEQLGINRAFYAEVKGDDWLVEGGYTHGVEPLQPGRYSAEIYGHRVMDTYRAGRNIVFRDTRVEPGFVPAERHAHLAIDIVAAVGVPLLKEGALVGILAVHAAAPRNWTDDEIALVQDTAERTWEAVERARAYLERSHALRTLEESNQRLERVNRELEEFAYAASHDLQEPLRMVNVYSQLLINRFARDAPQAKDYGQFIRQGVSRMESLLEDLLTYSQTIHQEGLPVGVADLSAALNEALSVLQSRVEESGAAITSEPLPKVRGDTAQLAHVFQNLLSNALKYRKPDVVPSVHISAERASDEWIITVRDNGIGFEQRYAQQIFGLFKRLHKNEYPGTGLGLAICQRMVERYGGRMWAESTPGEGSSFFFALAASER